MLLFVIRQRLADLGCEQRDLARAAEVTESYISQLLTRKKAPPAPHRTDMYDKMGIFLQLPRGELARLAHPPASRRIAGKIGGGRPPVVSDIRRLDSPQWPPTKAPYLRAMFFATATPSAN